MVNMANEKSLDAQLREDGWLIISVISITLLDKGLSSLAEDISKKLYSNVRIIPGEVAMEGGEWKLLPHDHVVYVKPSKHYAKEVTRKADNCKALFTHSIYGGGQEFNPNSPKVYDVNETSPHCYEYR